MFDFHEKRKIRSFLYSKIVVLALFLVAMLMSTAVYNRYTASEDMKERLETRQEELSELKTRAEALESQVEYLKNDRGIEEELRNRFDVARKGEQVIILLDAKEKNEHAGDSSSSPKLEEAKATETQKSFLERLKFW